MTGVNGYQEEDLSYYKGVKHSLKSIIKRPKTQEIIKEAVDMSNKITIHVTLFLKMYLLNSYDKNGNIPKVNRNLCVNIMKVICEESNRVVGEELKNKGRKPSQNTIYLKDELRKFYKDHYEPNWIKKESLSYKNMNTMMDYGFDKLVTNYENNIKQHFVEHVERFVNVMMKKKERLNEFESDIEKKKFLEKLRKIKNGVLERKTDDIPECFLDHLPFIIPQRSLERECVKYDLQVHPQDYLPCMIYMGKKIELDGESVFKVFPIRNNIIPRYVRIDTTSLVHLCINKENRGYFGTKDELLRHGNLVKEKDNIWSNFFRTELRCFNYARKERKPFDVSHRPRCSLREKRYQFDHQIETDGEAVTIILIRKDIVGKIFRPKQEERSEEYIDEVNRSYLEGKNIVGIDPNKQDLIHCSMLSNNGERVGFRYTQDQRRKETKSKKYSKINDRLKKNSYIEGKTIKEWETELSQHNSKTLNLEEFKAYVRKKNEINKHLMAFYSQRLFRQLKWYAFINRKRTERLMLQRFLNTFGSPENVVIAFGDWEQKKQMKYKEPTKGKGMRKLFREFGYMVYLVDEFRTSCKCYNCKSTEPKEGYCEKFRICNNPRPWKADMRILRHGVIKCKTCCTLWNRDVLSSLNMEAIGTCAKLGLPRPKYLCRGRVDK